MTQGSHHSPYAPFDRVRVELAERSYDIHIGCGTIRQAADLFASADSSRRYAIISDDRVGPLYGRVLTDSLRGGGCDAELHEVPAGETSKSVAVAEWLWQRLVERGCDRRTTVVALGGGVVGDLAGFVAATLNRGVSFIQVPTTLLADVDSSVGGKVGINLPQAKNIVGCFWQPDFVLIDLELLDSLPDREFAAGLAEVVKYGVIYDASFFEWLEQNIPAILARDKDALRTIARRCCEIKAEVVRADERETTGRRMILNYGHTYGHALETITQYRNFVHGEAVAIGMVCASRLAALLGMISAEVVERQRRLLERFGLPTVMPAVDIDELVATMRRDKKSIDGALRLILPARLGEVRLVPDVPVGEIMAALRGLDEDG